MGVSVGAGVLVGDGVGVAEGVEVDVCGTRLVAVGVKVAAGVSVGTNVALGVIVGASVETTTAIGVDVGTSVAVGCNVGTGVAVAVAVATGVGDGKTTVGEDGNVAINIGVGVLRSLTQPAISVVATIPETTATATRDNPDVTPASSRRTCNQPLQQSPATSRAA